MKVKVNIVLFVILVLFGFKAKAITFTTTLPNGSSNKDIPVVAGELFELTFDLQLQNTAQVRLVISEGSTIHLNASNLSQGYHSFRFLPTTNTVNIMFQRLDNDNATRSFAVDNLEYTQISLRAQQHVVGDKQYELTDHLGNVRAVISDKPINNQAQVVSATDYYPFGMEMPGRTFSTPIYRYGFNGMEKEDAWANGNYDFEARLYDARISSFLSVDPLMRKFPFQSPYTYAANNPIYYVDNEGKDYEVVVQEPAQTGQRGTIIIQATFYTTKEDAKRATAAANSLNSESGNYEFVDKKTGVVYDIKIEITVKEAKNPDSKARADISGNAFNVKTDEDLAKLALKLNPIEEPGYTTGGEIVNVATEGTIAKYPDGKTTPLDVDKHEMLHTLGVDYGVIDKGIGKNVSALSEKIIGAILEFAAKETKKAKIKVKESSRLDREAGTETTPKAKVKFKGKELKLKGSVKKTEKTTN